MTDYVRSFGSIFLVVQMAIPSEPSSVKLFEIVFRKLGECVKKFASSLSAHLSVSSLSPPLRFLAEPSFRNLLNLVFVNEQL